MWTKKIEIKDENHLKEVVKALESNGERIWSTHLEYPSVKSFWYENTDNCWYSDSNSNGKFETDKDVPEFEIITNTSYELKEVSKIKITCENCGKEKIFDKEEEIYKDFVSIGGSIIFSSTKTFSTGLSENDLYICKDCMKKLINN